MSNLSSPSPPLSPSEIVELDQRHVWHPYASLPNTVPCFAVKAARGVHIELSDGIQLVDGMSSWWAAIHGYNHPALNQAAINQMYNMSHIMFGGLTHQPAVQLAERLVEITPDPLQHVFYCDSGSVAVEVALKMALQYCYNQGHKQKHRFLTIRGGYHGDTFQPMSVCDPINGMHHLFQSVLAKQLFADRPQTAYDQDWDESDIDSFKDLLAKHHEEIAGVILEPIVQGAGGMYFYHPNYLRRVRELCDEFDVLLICDEIATGFGRTGHMFACAHAGPAVSADILCIGKALSGGFMSFAATMATTKVSEVFAKGESGVLMHGPTFMGNPLACAVSLESLNLLHRGDWKSQVGSIEQQLKNELEPCRSSSLVQDVRVLGAIGVVEMKQPLDMKTVQPWIVDQGVWLRPFGKLLYAMPPFCIGAKELRKITSTMVSLASRLPK